MPMPKIHRDVENRIKEIWAEEPTRSGQDVWNRLQNEPIRCPSLRKVQQIVRLAKSSHVPTDPEVSIEPWQHDWFEDPDKAKTLLLMHHTKSAHGGSTLTEREAKWGLRIVRFFNLSSPDEAQSFLEMAETYANRERLALTLNSPLDTTKLDEMLLARSGILSEGLSRNPEASPEASTVAMIDETDGRIGESKPKPTRSASTIDQTDSEESQGISSDLVELWQQIDCELALIDRQRFNAISFRGTSGETDWNCSKEKAIFDAREQEIQTMADRLFTTPEGRTAHERFIRETKAPVRVQVSDVPRH